MGQGVRVTRGVLEPRTFYSYQKVMGLRSALHACALTNTLKFYTHSGARFKLENRREILYDRIGRHSRQLPMWRCDALMVQLVNRMNEDKSRGRKRPHTLRINVAERPMVRKSESDKSDRWIFRK